jgi:serine/threonine protein kinase
LKPENLLLSTKNRWDGTIKVIDFGCAVLEDMEDSPHPEEEDDFKVNARKANSNGTTAYWSPERFDESSLFATKAMDMWSVGVILYIMLTGVHPFDPKGISTDEEIENRIMENPEPPMDKEFVGHLSESAIDVIQKLMAKDPAQRITAYDMLHHPWVRGETALTEKMKDSDTKLSQYKDLRYKLQAGIFGMLVQQGHADARLSEFKVNRKQSKRDENASHILKRAFDVIDTEGKGFINAADLGRVVKEHTGSDVSSRDTQEFLATQSGEEQSTVSALSLSMFNKLFSGLHQRHFPRGHYIFRAVRFCLSFNAFCFGAKFVFVS